MSEVERIAFKVPNLSNPIPVSNWKDEYDDYIDNVNEFFAHLFSDEDTFIIHHESKYQDSIAIICPLEDGTPVIKARSVTGRGMFSSEGEVKRIKLYDSYKRHPVGGMECILKWQGRRNRHKIFLGLPSGFTWLKEYTGPTVWNVWDKKAATEEAIANSTFVDRFGAPLAVGTRVLYINTRYGFGPRIDVGVIYDISAKIHPPDSTSSHYDSFHLKIRRDGDSQESSIKVDDNIMNIIALPDSFTLPNGNASI